MITACCLLQVVSMLRAAWHAGSAPARQQQPVGRNQSTHAGFSLAPQFIKESPEGRAVLHDLRTNVSLCPALNCCPSLPACFRLLPACSRLLPACLSSRHSLRLAPQCRLSISHFEGLCHRFEGFAW